MPVIALVDAGLAERVVAVDENTSLIVSPAGVEVAGLGSVWAVQPGEQGVNVMVLAADRSCHMIEPCSSGGPGLG